LARDRIEGPYHSFDFSIIHPPLKIINSTSPSLYLLLAILLELAGATAMKFSDGFGRIIPSILAGVFYLVSMGVMIMAVKTLEIGLIYAIWSGLGTATITGIGIV
jgi:multidrug transporter EmrE-like cation transporter